MERRAQIHTLHKETGYGHTIYLAQTRLHGDSGEYGSHAHDVEHMTFIIDESLYLLAMTTIYTMSSNGHGQESVEGLDEPSSTPTSKVFRFSDPRLAITDSFMSSALSIRYNVIHFLECCSITSRTARYPCKPQMFQLTSDLCNALITTWLPQIDLTVLK